MKSLVFSLIVFFSLNYVFAKDLISIDVSKLNEEKNIESNLYGIEAKNRNIKDILNGKFNAELKLIDIDEINKKNRHYWLGFQLTNSSLKKVNLLIGTTKFDYINFYIGDTIEGFRLTKGGLLLKNNDRKIISGPASFAELSVEPKQSKLVYIEVKNLRSPDFDYSPVPLQLFEASSFYEHEENNQKFMFFVLGAILLMALYNFFIYWIVKDNAYLYYVGYNLSFCSFILITEGGFIQKYFENSYYQFTAVNHTGSIILIFYILFAKKMLNIKLWYPKLDKALNIIFISYFVSELCTILEFNSIATILNFLLSSVTLNIIAIAAGLIYFKKHYLPAKYFFSALLFYFTGAIIMIMQMLHLLPVRILGLGWSEFLQTGEVMQLTFFSLSLASRFAVIRQQLAKEELEKEKILRQKDIELKAILEKENQILEEKFQARSKELEASQSRLIQQEKLASLGQLTAGIAHEIKNPLNFVTNFSEIGKELLDDFLGSKNNDERSHIANDLKDVLGKINEHGKRVDGIVKSMLEHSRSTKGEMILVDINKLCEEYLNLSYHGMRANNVNFNCEIVKNFSIDSPKIHLIKEDMARVLLNLLNNAFYEVNEKCKNSSDYYPKVELSTIVDNKNLIIKVRDNGKGIPNDLISKIFEPFYTTKPTGSGTGLGLSLSHDIVKAQGGELKVSSKLNEYTEFTINLEL